MGDHAPDHGGLARGADALTAVVEHVDAGAQQDVEQGLRRPDHQPTPGSGQHHLEAAGVGYGRPVLGCREPLDVQADTGQSDMIDSTACSSGSGPQQ